MAAQKQDQHTADSADGTHDTAAAAPLILRLTRRPCHFITKSFSVRGLSPLACNNSATWRRCNLHH
jgi:hypothetical protein